MVACSGIAYIVGIDLWAAIMTSGLRPQAITKAIPHVPLHAVIDI